MGTLPPRTSGVVLSDTVFDLLRAHIQKICGIVVTPEKRYLIHHRLEPILSTNSIPSFDELYRQLTVSSPSPRLQDQVVAAITTNETFFFRDRHPFETIRDTVLPELVTRARERKLRAQGLPGPFVSIWSAASSTGQEPYTLAMILHQSLGSCAQGGVGLSDFRILGTDISPRALAQASEGVYNELEIGRGLPPELRDRYFQPEGRNWKVRSEIRCLVELRRLNLTVSLPRLGPFDLILCRNVLIYFDDATKRKIVENLAGCLNPGGYLFLGVSENLMGQSSTFESVRRGDTLFYRLRQN